MNNKVAQKVEERSGKSLFCGVPIYEWIRDWKRIHQNRFHLLPKVVFMHPLAFLSWALKICLRRAQGLTSTPGIIVPLNGLLQNPHNNSNNFFRQFLESHEANFTPKFFPSKRSFYIRTAKSSGCQLGIRLFFHRTRKCFLFQFTSEGFKHFNRLVWRWFVPCFTVH